MTEFLLAGIGFGFAAAFQPGPFITYLISQTLSYGFRRTWIAALAPLISDGPIIALTLFALSQMPAWLQRGLYLASGLFILYLAWGTLKKWQTFGGIQAEPQNAPAGIRSLFKAALMNALSPMPYIYWSLVTGPILLAGWRQSPQFGILFLVGFYSILIGGLLALMIVFAATQNLGEKISKALLGVAALALVIFGLLQFWRGISG